MTLKLDVTSDESVASAVASILEKKGRIVRPNTRPGLGISVPVTWEELDGLQSADQWNVTNVHERLDVGNAPWDDYAASAKGLAPAMKWMKFKPGQG